MANAKKYLDYAGLSTLASSIKTYVTNGLNTKANISHTQDFTTITNRGEAFLNWGGQNFSGSYGPIDAAMIPELGANRFAFLNNVDTSTPSLSITYSRDGGSTWIDYGATTAQKINLFNGNGGYAFTIGKADSSHIATNQYQLKIEILTGLASVYTVLNKFIVLISSSGTNNNWITIKGRTQANYESSVDTWVTFANKVPISGWSGYNVINTTGITTYGNSPASQYGQLQIIFGCDTGSTSSYIGMNIQKIFAFGGVGWTTPSTMAKNNLIYTYDYAKNVTFPAGLQAASFIKSGGTANQFLKANGTVDSNAYIYQADRGLSIVSSKVGHSNTSITAQTTQAIYPIKIDTYGHITAYGSAVTIPTVNNGQLTISGSGTAATTFTANQSENSTVNFVGSGATTVIGSTNGTITISSTDNDTKNTAGATHTASIIYPIGVLGTGTNPQTYTDAAIRFNNNKIFVAFSSTASTNSTSTYASISYYYNGIHTYNSERNKEYFLGFSADNGDIMLPTLYYFNGEEDLWFEMPNESGTIGLEYKQVNKIDISNGKIQICRDTTVISEVSLPIWDGTVI